MNDQLKPNTNSGVLIAPPKPTDYVAGGISAVIYRERLTGGQWNQYRPTGESQNSVYFDTMSCVSFSAANVIEEQVNWMIATKQLSVEQMQLINELGFIDENGLFNVSDRFIAKMSGTTRSGNYLNAVWEAIRKYGLLPEKDWSYPRDQRTPVFDWDAYMAEIPQALKDKALRIFEVFQIGYEWVAVTPDSLQYHLKQAPIQIAAKVCSPWNTTDIIQACGLASQHATVIDGYAANEYWTDFDHYPPYGKRLAWDYNISSGIKGIVELKDNKLINKITMVMIKKQGDSAIYAQIGDVLVPFTTNWETYQKDFGSAKIVEISATEFAKYRIASAVAIKAK